MMLQRFFTVTAGLLAGLAVIVAGLMLIAVVITYPRLPSLDVLTDYRPKMPLRVYSADNVLIGEFGEERRSFTRIQDVPQHMKQALLAAEDERFYQHGGIDYLGVLRAAVGNIVSRSRALWCKHHYYAGGKKFLLVQRAHFHSKIQ